MEKVKYHTFKEFYPYYISEHNNSICRLLHFIGTSFVLAVFTMAIVRRDLRLLVLCPLVGYIPAWIGHFFFEKNRPATFQYPLFSLKGDFLMYWQILTGELKIFNFKKKN